MTGEFTMFYGGAGGSAQKALRRAEFRRVLVSYATKNNRVWEAVERLFVDSGGFSVLTSHGEYPTPPEAYVEYLAEHEERLVAFALRDYPVAPKALAATGLTAAEHLTRTVDLHAELLELVESRDLDAEPVAVAQGRAPQEYLCHLDDLRDRGCLTDYVGVGSLVGREPEEARDVVLAVREALPSRHRLHGFGVSRDVLAFPSVVDALDTADSCAYERRARWDSSDRGVSCDFRHVMFHLLKFRRRVRELVDDAQAESSQGDAGRTTLAAFGGDA